MADTEKWSFMSDDSSGGIGLIATLLLIAITAHLLGYSGIARIAFWIALSLLIIIVLIVLVVLAAAILVAIFPRV